MVRRLCDALRPDEYVEALEQVDLAHLYDRGIRGILVDRDRTLTAWRSDEVSEEKLQWLDEARKRFSVCIVSNTIFVNSLNELSERLDLPVVSRWGLGRKPMPGAMKAGLRVVDVAADQAAMIGDQLFTDVLGGNLQGMYTVLVQPVPGPEFAGTAVARVLERGVMALMNIELDENHKKG
ncbi:MAG: YqeG family HAD IIIA-type phosphatase [Armatimonadota bacterium]